MHDFLFIHYSSWHSANNQFIAIKNYWNKINLKVFSGTSSWIWWKTYSSPDFMIYSIEKWVQRQKIKQKLTAMWISTLKNYKKVSFRLTQNIWDNCIKMRERWIFLFIAVSFSECWTKYRWAYGENTDVFSEIERIQEKI